MPFEICCSRWLIPHPCIGDSVSVFRISRSSVPRRTSAGASRISVSCSLLGFRQNSRGAPVGSQQEFEFGFTVDLLSNNGFEPGNGQGRELRAGAGGSAG